MEEANHKLSAMLLLELMSMLKLVAVSALPPELAASAARIIVAVSVFLADEAVAVVEPVLLAFVGQQFVFEML